MSKKYKNQSTNNIIRGFTLIELLAVIVILAIIALIAVPIVLNIISDSKVSSIERSAELYLDAVENTIVKENLKRKFNPEECEVQINGDLLCDETETLLVEMSGKKPSDGTITFSNGKITYFINLKYDSGYVSKGESSEYELTIEKKTKIITFTYDGTVHTAEEGMTWQEYVNSSYNVDLASNGIYGLAPAGESDNYIVESENPNTPVLLTDVIKANGVYSHQYCCFDPGTQVLMMDGTTKNIEDIQVGEYVMSYNEENHEFEPKKVLRTITKHHSDDLVYVNLSNGERIGMRAYHPLLTTDGYKSLRPELVQTIMETGHVEKLKVGDILVGYDSNVAITSIEIRKPIENYDTYNLEVEGNHNYIVNGIVAHNANCVSDSFVNEPS